MEHGLLINGQIEPNTEWCLRDPEAMWDPESTARHPDWKGWAALDRYQLQKTPPNQKTDILTGHWTAGEAGTKTFDDDGARVVSVMKRRRSRKNKARRLRVSVSFVIGACDPCDEYAPVWQTLELGTGWAGIHVGRRDVNVRSVGVEVVSAGAGQRFNSRDRREIHRNLLGQEVSMLEFYPGQLRSWVRLANALAESTNPFIQIPKQVPVGFGADNPYDKRFTRRQQNRWEGAMEHYLMDNTTKIDAGSLLLESLLADGWKGVKP